MPPISHITALIIVPPADAGSTADLYRSDDGAGPLLATAVEAVTEWPVDAVVVVLGDDAETLIDDVHGDVDILVDPEWVEGSAAALRSGFDLVFRGDTSDAVLVVLLDRPLPEPELVRQVIAAAHVSHLSVAAAKYRYAFDHPYVVHSDVWDRVLGMEGDASIESLVATHPDRVEEAWIDRVPPKRYGSAADVGAPR